MRAIALTLLLVACAGTDKETGGLVGDPEAGADVYATNCASCHGANGEGGTGSAMTEAVPESTDAQIEDEIVNGNDEGMPAFTLEDQEMADLLAYLRETYGG